MSFRNYFDSVKLFTGKVGESSRGRSFDESMDDSRLTDFVTTFLKKKGFNEAETAFRAELQRKNNNGANNNSIDVLNDPELSKFFRSFSEYFFALSLLNFLYYFLCVLRASKFISVLGLPSFNSLR